MAAWSKYSSFLPVILLMPSQIEVGAVVDSFDLLPAEGELVLDIERGLGVVSQLVGPCSWKRSLAFANPEVQVPLDARFPPPLEPLDIGARLDEELHLHLLELAGAEDEVARA